MPQFPHFSRRIASLTGSVFEKFREKMKAGGKNLVRLHIGDTYLPPAYELPLSKEFMARHPDFNRYCHTFGVAPLRSALAVKLQEDNQLHVDTEQVMVTNGATNGLSATAMTLLDPGDEVIVLTPAWPFFFGMVTAAGGKVVEAPIYMDLFKITEMDLAARLEPFCTDKTVAIYVNSPNNPTGKVLNESQLAQIARFARQHNFWIISDEAYDGLTFDDRPHISIATLENAAARTITLFTFSKSLMFAGIRLGFLTGSEEVVRNINKAMVHQLYSPATFSQYMMIDPLKKRREWLPAVRQHYQNLRDFFIERLKFPVHKPEGTYFIFCDVEPFLRGRDYWQLFNQLLEAGVSVAPGGDFGQNFEHYIRICFTGEPAPRLEIAAERINSVLVG